MTISVEVPAQTEARLRSVMNGCALDWLPGTWAFREGPGAAVPGAIATVRDEGRTSALVPAGAGTELFEVLRVVLPRGRDDSGFVGWFASQVKAATGSGLFVVCGYDAARGGVYDYYGVPRDAAQRVRAAVAALHRPAGWAGAVLTVADPGPDAPAPFGPGVVFCFAPQDGSLLARYGGGRVAHGLLTASGSTGTVQLHFSHLDVDGTAHGGSVRAELGGAPDGSRTLTVHPPAGPVTTLVELGNPATDPGGPTG
ncbi:DUF6196 family protein [Pseudonocardia sp. ICBG1293]|uniref:DUF6196 family protein n=1 Tax=Pseudonocardia sp. ICBG1293 TaxID=2844382 RepID=UPI001CCDA091|nr:DUF6196 family protein [Pseudonocardia sp. ICBG1293]